MFRYKGMLAVKGMDTKYLLQGFFGDRRVGVATRRKAKNGEALGFFHLQFRSDYKKLQVLNLRPIWVDSQQ